MLGFIPPTFALFAYIAFFARGARTAVGVSDVGDLLFLSYGEILIASYIFLYIVSAVLGYFIGWDGFRLVAKKTGGTVEKIKFPRKVSDRVFGPKVDMDAKIISPRERVEMMHDKS
ncbi:MULTISPECIES: hypothetical protein [Microbulbifer]|uniref:hypothetical protein n=1 Tax=Microbulbifer TaxID=48073 RepID=UPI00058CE917|nr:hypothetical protein [Microbulbifer variabilis]